MIQYGVAALVKDMPSQVVFCAIPTGKHENGATADCALSWIIRVALNPSNHPGWTTSSRRCEILGVKDGRLRIRTTAPPTDGRANKDVIRQLAKAFKIPPSRITLKRGATGRDKTFVIESLQGVPECVEEAVTSPNISRVAATMKENV